MNLCTLDEVKSWLNIQPITDTSEDAILTQLIGWVSQNVRRYCSRDFDQQAYTEVYNGVGSDKLFLKNSPIVSVASLVVNGAVIPASAAYNQAGFQFDSDMIYLIGGGGVPPQSWNGSAAFSRGIRNISITYTAGFLRNTDPATDQLPQDLRMAAIEAVALKYRRRTIPHKTSETLGGENTSYLTDEFTKQIRGILDRYRRVTPINTA